MSKDSKPNDLRIFLFSIVCTYNFITHAHRIGIATNPEQVAENAWRIHPRTFSNCHKSTPIPWKTIWRYWRNWIRGDDIVLVRWIEMKEKTYVNVYRRWTIKIECRELFYAHLFVYETCHMRQWIGTQSRSDIHYSSHCHRIASKSYSVSISMICTLRTMHDMCEDRLKFIPRYVHRLYAVNENRMSISRLQLIWHGIALKTQSRPNPNQLLSVNGVRQIAKRKMVKSSIGKKLRMKNFVRSIVTMGSIHSVSVNVGVCVSLLHVAVWTWIFYWLGGWAVYSSNSCNNILQSTSTLHHGH